MYEARHQPPKRCTVLEAVTLHSRVTKFLPEGDAFGIGRMDADAFLDAGFIVAVMLKL